MKTTILFLTILSVGLIAGLFYSWSISVMLGLKKVPAKEFIVAMQAMNRAIQNPLFLSCFMGALVLLASSCWLQYQKPLDTSYYLLIAATLLYAIGVVGITFGGNIPLNNMLDAFDVNNANENAMMKLRTAFESKWNNLNNIRTVFAILSFATLILMLLVKKPFK
jgi:uncharacterized membrane protein